MWTNGAGPLVSLPSVIARFPCERQLAGRGLPRIGRLVFGGAPLSQLGRFVAVYMVVYLLNVGLVALLLRAGLNVYLANALVILPLALLAFVLQRQFVFQVS